jgi:predicted transcriptional regulator
MHMSETFSWVRAFREGTLTPMQLEALEALVDNGEADSMAEAARLLDIQATTSPGGEPGTVAY